MRGAGIAALHAALLFGAMGAALPATARVPAGATSPFAPPEGEPMVLTRTLRRELSDGKAIVATRSYRLSFMRSGDGWTIDGALVASEIDAPPALAALAALERERPDDTLFPIRLDAAGIIQPRAGSTPPDGSAWRAALDVASSMVAARLEPAGDPAAPGLLQQHMQTVAGAASLTRWPLGLFLPESGTSREERRFALPDGGEGIIVTELARIPAVGLATMGEAERTVVTQVAGTRRITRERWSLTRIGG